MKHKLCHLPLTSSYPFIGNDLFYDSCDIVYNGTKQITKQGSSFRIIKIFLPPSLIVNFLELLVNLNQSTVLVSRSNDDELIPYISSAQKQSMRLAYETILSNKNVILWFASNAVVSHPKIVHMPLGTKWAWSDIHWHAEEMHKRRAHIVLQKYARNIELNFYRAKVNLAHFRMSVHTSDVSLYEPWRSIRRKAEKVYSERFSNQDIKNDVLFNISCPQDIHSVHEFEKFLVDLSTFKFTFSPPGRGPDVHRTWEALLMGSIPIVQSGPLDSLYSDLPVLIVDSWEEVTTQLLSSLYPVYLTRVYNFKKLLAPYWLNKIEEASFQIR